MKRFPETVGILTVALMSLIVLSCFAGCQSWSKDATARDKYADAERTFQTTVDAAMYGVKSGKLKGETLALVKAALIEANAALAEMHARVRTGDPVEADYWLERVNAAVNAAARYLEENAAKTTQG